MTLLADPSPPPAHARVLFLPPPNKQVIQGVYPGVTTSELDELAAQTSAYMATQHPDFSKLAARISVSNLHKQTEKVRWMRDLGAVCGLFLSLFK